MKLKDNIKITLLNMRNSIKRFPITILISIIFAILQIYINEQGYDISRDLREMYNRLTMVVGLGIPLSLFIGLIKENFLRENKIKEVGIYIIGLLFLVFYYNFLILDFRLIPIARYVGLMLFLFLGIFYISGFKKDEHYEFRVMTLFFNFTITFIYSVVLFLGISAIIFTIDKLFDVNIDEKYYFYMFLIVTFVFGISLFLSKFPKKEEEFKDYDYTTSLKVLLNYIVIPLITVYTIILYVYFVKILITWQWPKGLVSHLVIWYSTLSVFIIFLITPILETNKISKAFKIWFPKVVLPILVMMFMSIWQRVDQYGITENRYFIIALGLWVTFIMLYYSFKNPLKNIIIPITLSLVVLNSVFGPFSSFSISRNSQNYRLIKLLEENNILEDGNIVKSASVSKEGQREISNIVHYFNKNHSINELKAFSNDFNIDKFEEVLGFAYSPNLYIDNPYNNQYFYYHLANTERVLDIQGFDYYANLNIWNTFNMKMDDMDLSYDRNNFSLELKQGNTILFKEDLKEIGLGIHNKLKATNNEGKEVNNLEDMMFEKDYGNVRIKMIFNNISGNYKNNEEVSIENLEYLILIDKK